MKSTPASMLTVAASLVLCLASTSFAEFQFASSANDSKANVSNGGTLSNGTGAPDGAFIVETATGNSGFHPLDLIFGFTFSSGGAYAPGVVLYGLTTSGGTVTLDNMTWGTDSTPGNSDDSGTFSFNQTLPAGPSDQFFTGPMNSFNTTFASSNYTFVYLHFSLSDGATLSLDAISNPEPGTIALFALGAAGLGGFAWKKRRARIVRAGRTS